WVTQLTHLLSELPDPSSQAEHETYLSLLAIILLISRGAPNRSGFELSHRLVTDFLPHHNRRSLDPLAAKIWFYHSRFAELLQQDGSHPGLWANLRSSSMSAHRTARLRRDEDSEATLLNLILWEQADRLVSKTEFPDFGKTEASVGAGGMVPTGQVARWLYYLAIRRAPPAQIAPGFWQTTHKLFVVVELLMGDIPDRTLFRVPVLKKCLQPYFEIVQASKTALQTILLAYSRNKLKDRSGMVLSNLHWTGPVVEWSVRKLMTSIQLVNLKRLSTKESVGVYIPPLENPFCLKLYNKSIEAMRFPLHQHSKELASAKAARGRERELASEILTGDDNDGNDDDLGDAF
ncbi:hypothetical protein PSHT_07899, partial [Puccinia striiformis]